MAKMEGVLYFKIIYAGKPAEYDTVGCDGLYIKSCEQVSEEIRLLEDVVEAAKKLRKKLWLQNIVDKDLQNALAKLEKK